MIGKQRETRRDRLLWVLVVLAATSVVAWLALPQRHVLRIDVTYGTTAAGPGEIFYAGSGEDFSAGQSTSFATSSDGKARLYQVYLPAHRPVTRLRIDPGTSPGTISLGTLEIRRRFLGLETTSQRVVAVPDASHHAGDVVQQSDTLRFTSVGNDPWVALELPDTTRAALDREVAWLRLLVALACGLAATMLAFVPFRKAATQGHRLLIASTRHRVLVALARAGSDAGAITFTPATMGVVILALAMAAAGMVGRLNFSSVGMWNQYLPSAGIEDPTLVGHPRAIRADEWLVATPWMLSQAANGYPLENPAVGSLHSTLLTSMPVRHAVAAVQPEFWGFAFFDVERAISWYWMYKLFGLFVSSLLLLLLLTRGDGLTSAMGALWLCLSSFTQWWFSTNLPEMLIGLCMALLGVLYICKAERRVMRIAGALATLLGAATFVFQLYPPFQVPLAYAGAAVVVGVMASRTSRMRFRAAAPERVILMMACAALMAGLVLLVLIDARETISTVVATVYPGRRFSVGGSVPWWMALDGIFEAWRVGEATFPWTNSNASESSDFVMLFPLAVAALLFVDRRLWRDPLVISLSVFCLLLYAWMVIPLSAELANLVSRLTLLSFVPPNRATAALGLASILLVAVVVARMRALGRGPGRVGTSFFVILAALATYQYGALLQDLDPTFFVGARIMLGCVVAGLMGWALARGSRRAFAMAALFIAIPGLLVNPLSRGLAPLLEQPVLAAAVAADGDKAPRWLVIGNFVIPQAFKAVGLDVFGGARYAPDILSMEILDPGHRHADVWNRYAHVQVESAAGIPNPRFTLVQGDLYRLQVDVCSEQLDALRIERVAYAGSAPHPDMRCLHPIGRPIDGISLYARTLPGQSE